MKNAKSFVVWEQVEEAYFPNAAKRQRDVEEANIPNAESLAAEVISAAKKTIRDATKKSPPTR